MSFIAYLYQLTGTVEDLTKSMFLMVWFNASAFVLMLTTGLICITATMFTSRRRAMLLAVSSVLALIAMAVFGFGLATSSFAVESLNPGYSIGQFPEGTFVLSAEQSMQRSYDYSWAIGIGFWLALVTSILALIAALIAKTKKST
jgi:hypothetical protein